MRRGGRRTPVWLVIRLGPRVVQTGDGHARPDPPVALPVDPDEDVGLLDVGAVHGLFRTYFTNNRGDGALGTTWSYLDLTALGRQEEWEDSPDGYPQTPPYGWWKWHDEYDAATPSQ
jgi:hypothetical protein